MKPTAAKNPAQMYPPEPTPAPALSKTEDSGCSLWKNSSTVPMPIEPITSAAMEPIMNPCRILRESVFMIVAKSRKPIATASCSPGSNGSMSSTIGTKPAAPYATATIVIISVHM